MSDLDRYRMLILDAPFCLRRPFEASGQKIDNCAGAAVGTILDLQERYQPEQTFCCWEASGSIGRAWGWDQEDDRSLLGRREIDAGYKAQRNPWPEDLVRLVDELMPVLGQIGVTNVCSEDEADDAIAALVKSGSPDVPALIWSADHDLLQLIRPGVSLVRDYAGSDKTPITSENIVERTGMTAAQWSSYLALRGDPGDGVVGVPRIGDQRARAILAAVPDGITPDSSREACLRAAAERDASIVKWVSWVFDHWEQFLTAWSLTQLRPDSPLRVTPPQPDREAAAAWFSVRGHAFIARRLASSGPDAWDDEEEEW